MGHIIECYGCITKVESLWCLEEFAISNSCLLESSGVFPGYYDRFTRHEKPYFVYIMSRNKLSLEEVTRMTSTVRKNISQSFNAAYCEITIHQQSCGGIRIAGVDDYAKIREIQTAYKDAGLELKKKVKNINNEKAVIKVRKFFQLEVLSEHILLDKTQQGIGYFKTESDVPWEVFEKNIKTLRNNWDDNSFDAAKSFIYQNSEITDLVRIFSGEITLEYMEKLRLTYHRYAGL